MAKTVLIVDDVAFVRKTLADIFRAGRYEVVGEASDGEQAVSLYMKLKPDFVTMDVVMPQMSGIDAVRKIMKLDKDAKIIMVSAMGQEHLIMEAINVGARDYILKPFSSEEILKTIERLLMPVERTGRPGLREQKS